MKKRMIQKILAMVVCMGMVLGMTACGGDAGEETAAPSGTETAEETDAGAGDQTEAAAEDFDPSQYSVAICMDSMNHPVHRIVQLGFLKAAEALGYENAKVIGTEGGDTSEAFAAAR